jgi:hypothetical protein
MELLWYSAWVSCMIQRLQRAAKWTFRLLLAQLRWGLLGCQALHAFRRQVMGGAVDPVPPFTAASAAAGAPSTSVIHPAMAEAADAQEVEG